MSWNDNSSDDDLDGDAKQEPSWAIPLTVFLITGVLSLGFLAYYFGPSVNEILGQAPSSSEEDVPIEVIIGGTAFQIPENFTRYELDRRGGIQEKFALHALLPNFTPYTPDQEATFNDNSAQSPVIRFEIEKMGDKFEEKQRFEKIYKRVVVDPEGEEGPYGFRVYQFSEYSGYKKEELFVRHNEDGTVAIIRCFKSVPENTSPSCRRDLKLDDATGLSYRFKRPYLDDWQEIDDGVRSLVLSFLKDRP